MNGCLLQNGSIVDGTGSPAFLGDLLIRGDRIVEVGSCTGPPDIPVIDCTGLTITPGFIDAHSHSDLQVLEGRPEKTRQGVTSEVVGNCGFSAYPAAADAAPLREFANGIFRGDDSWGWARARDYLEAIKRSPSANVFSLAGHGSLRLAVSGNKQGRLSETELDRMEQHLDEALQAGAAGFSTGLMYAPGSSAPFEELERLCRVVARRGKVYATHMRSYFSGVLASVEEQLELARQTGCRLQISHLQVVGAKNWGMQARVLERIEQAAANGIDVAFDCYPYVAGSTVLTQLLPQAALDGGTDAMLARLRDPATRARLTAQVDEQLEWRWPDIYISAVATDRNQSLVGMNLGQIADARSVAPVEVMVNLLIEERGRVNMLSFNQSEENLRQTLTHPLSAVISDGFYVHGRPHPRLGGTFPLLLGTIARKRGWMTLAEAVRKITDYPARRFRMDGRGRLAPGGFADIAVFDADTVDSPATYEDPELRPVGIRHVFRNGRLMNLEADR